MEPSACVVLVPIGSHLEPETEAGLAALQARGYVVRTLRGTADVALARSCLATEALRDGFRETMWIDSDIVFAPDDVDRLRKGGPFVAGLYARKSKKFFGQGPRYLACKFRDDAGGVWFGPSGRVLEMQYVGMGFTYVRAEVFEAMGLADCEGGYDGKTVKPYFLPALADEGRGALCYLAEDYAFCQRARLAGFPPHADTTINLGHVGRYEYTLADLMQKEDSMSDEALFAKIGRQQLLLEQQDAAYDALLGLLAGVVKGDVDPSRLLVNLTDRTWTLAPAGQRPATPATINGLPACVVAPQPPPAPPEPATTPAEAAPTD